MGSNLLYIVNGRLGDKAQGGRLRLLVCLKGVLFVFCVVDLVDRDASCRYPRPLLRFRGGYVASLNRVLNLAWVDATSQKRV